MARDGHRDQAARGAEAGAGNREVRAGQQAGTRPGDHLEAEARGRDILQGHLDNQRVEEDLEAETEL